MFTYNHVRSECWFQIRMRARGSHSPVFFRVARVGGAQRPHVHVAHASSPGPAVCRPGPADAAARVPAAFARVAAIPVGPRIHAAPAAASAATRERLPAEHEERGDGRQQLGYHHPERDSRDRAERGPVDRESLAQQDVRAAERADREDGRRERDLDDLLPCIRSERGLHVGDAADLA